MGTRAVTKVIDEDSNIYVRLYRQYDGYPSAHGAEIAEFLEDAVIVNGIRMGEPRTVFNGTGDLAARLISFFKPNHAEAGSFYLVADDGWDASYYYEIHVSDASYPEPEGSVLVKVKDYNGHTIFNGTPDELAKWSRESVE